MGVPSGWKRISTDYELKHSKRAVYQNLGTIRRKLIDAIIKDVLNPEKREAVEKNYGKDYFKVPILEVSQDGRGHWFALLTVPWNRDWETFEVAGDVGSGKEVFKRAIFFMKFFPDINKDVWEQLRYSWRKEGKESLKENWKAAERKEIFGIDEDVWNRRIKR